MVSVLLLCLSSDASIRAGPGAMSARRNRDKAFCYAAVTSDDYSTVFCGQGTAGCATTE